MPNDPPEPGVGAPCLPHFAGYLNLVLSPNATLDAVAGQNNQYVLVHLYLVPGERRLFKESIEAELLGTLKGTKLHDLAFAIPCCRGDERGTAQRAWQALLNAGAGVEGEPVGWDAWDAGDVAYIHYLGPDGMCVLAVAPREGRRLPNP